MIRCGFTLGNRLLGDDYQLHSQKPLKKEFLTETVDFADRKTSNTFYHAYNIIYNKLDKSNGLVFRSGPVKKPLTINGCLFGRNKGGYQIKKISIITLTRMS